MAGKVVSAEAEGVLEQYVSTSRWSLAQLTPKGWHPSNLAWVGPTMDRSSACQA